MRINTLYTNALNGNKASEEELFQCLLDRFRYSVHHRIWDKDAAEEIVQDALLTIVQEYSQVEIHTSFAAWAYKVVDNKILGYIKKKKQSAGTMVEYSDFSSSIQGKAIDPTLRRVLLDCLKKLSKTRLRYSRVLILHYQGFSISEISEKMKLTRNAFYLLLSRSRKMLAECIENGKIE